MQLSNIALAISTAYGALFSPSSLFSSGEQGVWYEPSDFNRYMSQLGPELVTNGTFDTDTSGWGKDAGNTGFSATVASGQLTIDTSSTSANAFFSYPITTVIGKTYVLTGTIVGGGASTRIIRKADNTGATLNVVNAQSGTGTGAVVFTATATTTYIVCQVNYSGSTSTGIFDNISVRELTAISTATLFQDAAGTLPVTAVEQPVGLMLDQSKGLVLGPELVTNGDFSNGTTGWSTWEVNAQISVAGGQMTVTQPVGGTQAGVGTTAGFSTVVGRVYKVTLDVISYTQSVPPQIRVGAFLGSNSALSTFLAAGTGTRTCFFTANATTSFITVATNNVAGNTITLDNISVRELPGNHAYQTTSASRPVLSARVNQYVGTAALATQNITTVATSYTLRFEGTGMITLSGTATGTYSAGSHTITCTAGTLTSTVSGTVTNADIRVANVGVGLPAYQRVNTSTNYDTVGFPLKLKTDGVDDFMVTNSINFSATDKMTVWAGVRHSNTAATGAFIETSVDAGSNAGSLAVYTNTTSYSWRTGGTIRITATGNVTPPITNALTGIGDISGDSAILRIDGTQAASSTADQGTGNYGNLPLYLFRRGGTTLPFNGEFYGLIVRGAQSSATQIQNAETYLNKLTKAY